MAAPSKSTKPVLVKKAAAEAVAVDIAAVAVGAGADIAAPAAAAVENVAASAASVRAATASAGNPTAEQNVSKRSPETGSAFFVVHRAPVSRDLQPLAQHPMTEPLPADQGARLDHRPGERHRPLPFRVIDESPHWIVVDKPPYLLVHPSKPDHRRTLWDELRALLCYEIACGGQVSIINRLDRETSGLTLIAKDHATASDFSRRMEQRRIQKEYLAIVWGWPAQDDWEVNAPILRQGERHPSRIYLKQMIHPDGAQAKTSFRVEQRFHRGAQFGGQFATIRARPETGRLHQIRVHLAHSG